MDKITKHIALIILACSTLLLHACIAEEDLSRLQSNDIVDLNIGIKTRITPEDQMNSGALGAAEYAIKSLRIYAFRTDGTLDKMEFVEYTNPLINNFVKHSVKVTKAEKINLRIVINEPANLTAELSLINDITTLDNINQTIAYTINDGFNGAATFTEKDFVLPMTASQSVNAMANYSEVTINADRAIARVDLMIDKDEAAAAKEIKFTSATTFTISQRATESKLFKPKELASATATDNFNIKSSNVTFNLKTDDRTTAQRVLSFYVAECKYSPETPNNQLKITIDQIMIDGTATVLNKPIIVGEGTVQSPLTTIDRNHIYRVYATYKSPAEPIKIGEITIADWNDVDVSGNVDGVLFSASEEVILDWYRNSRSFKSEKIPYHSNKPISIEIPGILHPIGKDEKLIYEFIPFDKKYVAGGNNTYDLKTLFNMDGTNYITQTKWLKKAELVMTSDRSGYFNFEYIICKTRCEIQQYPIHLKSANVTKSMRVVYDNGYIPKSELDATWQKEAPNGIVFSKRGYALHPNTADTIVYRNADNRYAGEHVVEWKTENTATTDTKETGYGRGPLNTAAAHQAGLELHPAVQYCKEKFGESWYVPSLEEMKQIQYDVTLLGVSYRFQNTGNVEAEQSDNTKASFYWTSSESVSPHDGQNQLINFVRYLYQPDGIGGTNPGGSPIDWEKKLTANKDKTTKQYVRCVLNL